MARNLFRIHTLSYPAWARPAFWALLATECCLVLLLQSSMFLSMAATHGWQPLVYASLWAGADLHRGNGYESPLHRACWRGHADVAETLLRYGADPNQTLPNNGNTPLHWAVVNGHARLAKLLLEHGADPTQVNRPQGATPLQLAQESPTPQMAPLLLAWHPAL